VDPETKAVVYTLAVKNLITLETTDEDPDNLESSGSSRRNTEDFASSLNTLLDVTDELKNQFELR
jgi:hypothetical protein